MSSVLKLLSQALNKGTLLELVIEDVFIDMRLDNVRKQKSGSQYGYDVIGFQDGKCWKAECKNLKSEATINDIAPKLIWHLDGKKIDKFIIVSVNGISNDLFHLFENHLFSFPIEIWHSEYLEFLIKNSPRARKRLEIKKSERIRETSPLTFLPKGIKFEVVYKRNTPFSYDYFKLDNELIKSFTEKDFKLVATISNLTKSDVVIKEVNVRTINYKSTKDIRVFRQGMAQGIIKAIQLNFIPKNSINGNINLIEGSLIEVKQSENEYLEFNLSSEAKSGYYELIFEISFTENGINKTLFSPIFPLHIINATNDCVRLEVKGKYYDTPVQKILDLEERIWKRIKQDEDIYLRFLGPNLLESDENFGPYWKVSSLKKIYKENAPKGFFGLRLLENDDETIELKIPIEEKLWSEKEFFKEMQPFMDKIKKDMNL
ncbi:hypothetical protein [Spongiimicrobium sp. 2-473A-2-J]|uniref:hypothetical protein n=1 Tax=Eudoraea algarum TaxID=3417568 RepID=UPI003D365054